MRIITSTEILDISPYFHDEEGRDHYRIAARHVIDHEGRDYAPGLVDFCDPSLPGATSPSFLTKSYEAKTLEGEMPRCVFTDSVVEIDSEGESAEKAEKRSTERSKEEYKYRISFFPANRC